jgi:hypothetical protein
MIDARLRLLPLLFLSVFLLVGCQEYPSADDMPSADEADNAIVHETPPSVIEKVSVARPDVDRKNRLKVIEYPNRQVLELRIGPADLETEDKSHYRSPAYLARFPFDGYLHGFDWKITASAPKKRVPDRMLHHLNIVSPNTRELFVPMAQRLLAAGRETPKQSISAVVGRPFEEGETMVAVGKFHHATKHDWEDAVLHIYLHYTKTNERWIAPWAAQPFYLDVMSPTGQDTEAGEFQKDFPVPPGRTEKTWTGSPSVDGSIVGIGGHLHDYGSLLRLEDLTTGEVLWETEPVTGKNGHHVKSVPSERFIWSGGIDMQADHRYRFTAVYENPTDEPSAHRGMGAMGGLFIPESLWPTPDKTNRTYLEELASFMSGGSPSERLPATRTTTTSSLE